jgi:hypothetical protein
VLPQRLLQLIITITKRRRMRRLQNFLSGARIDAASPPPYFLHVRSSKLFILTTICIAVFTDMFLYGIIVPVIPFALTSRAGVVQSSIQSWTSILLACYGAALLVCSPFAGWYADRSSSRRLPLLGGLLALGGATIMLCLARTVSLLVAGRILQGASAAIVCRYQEKSFSYSGHFHHFLWRQCVNPPKII